LFLWLGESSSWDDYRSPHPEFALKPTMIGSFGGDIAVGMWTILRRLTIVNRVGPLQLDGRQQTATER
jgi:hypothetical protein